MAGYGDALEFDLMTMSNHTLDELGRGLSCRALASFVRHLPKTSATFAAIDPEGAKDAVWESQGIVPQLLAQVIDELRMFSWAFAQSRSKHSLKSQMPEPIPRPGVKAKGGAEHYGTPLPADEFDAWFNSKLERREDGR